MIRLRGILASRPRWVRHAAIALAKHGSIEKLDRNHLAALCIKEALRPESVPVPDLSDFTINRTASAPLKLRSIAEVEGINRLAPREPLSFGPGGLTIVYGRNRSGKSGYVRILKHVCGARNPGDLKPDVSSAPPAFQKCEIGYELGDTTESITWTADTGPVDPLTAVDIFDSREGAVFVTEENEVAYEPRELVFLADLIEICGSIREGLSAKQEALVSSLPAIPPNRASSKIGRWYSNLSAEVTKKEIDERLKWDEEEVERLAALRSLQPDQTPEGKAKAIKREAAQLRVLSGKVQRLVASYATANCERIRRLHETAIRRRAAAKAAGEVAFSEAPLEGVGSDVWRELWEHARAYSTRAAYPDRDFPNTAEGARCVLCQDVLSEPAQRRLESFEEFVQGEAEKKARAAERTLSSELERLEEIPEEGASVLSLDAAGIGDDSIRKLLSGLGKSSSERRAWITSDRSTDQLPQLPDVTTWLKETETRLASLERQASALSRPTDAASAADSNGLSELEELAAREWVVSQRAAILAERKRLGRVKALESARSLTSTTALSTRKGELAQELVSDAFATRFRDELDQLGARSVPAEFHKTRTERGHTLHRLRYHGLEGSVLSDILSEGEFRVVALAACLADGATNHHDGPFVFDDPISSLDDEFEEAVAKRLVKLSEERQTIVFTHRLSFLSLLVASAKKWSVPESSVGLTAEPWGTGQPGDVPFHVRRPNRALNRLLNERIPQAKKELETSGTAAYSPLASGITSDFRMVVERIVELHLINGVVERWRRSIQTDGRIGQLSRITEADCTFIDEVMSKYSIHEHAQPRENPGGPPDPDELAEDVARVKAWLEEFSNRE
jgi:energy-coupling factor transporter ATP-binding protein EcfA2